MTNILETTPFGATSTTDDVLSRVNLKGKRILVTGVSAGLGVETARSLVARGAEVVGAARDLNKATAATEHVRTDAAANGGSFEVIELDLANLKSVRAVVAGAARHVHVCTRCLRSGKVVKPAVRAAKA